jgi:negative regulator of sigma E activity
MRVSLSLGVFCLTSIALAQPPTFRLDEPPRANPLNKGLPRLSMLGKQILRRMVKAEMSVPFQAREITIGREGRSSEQWVKRDPKRGVRRESIQPAGLLLVDNRKRQFLIQQKDKRYQEGKSQLAEIQKRFAQALQAGEGALLIVLQGQDTIAGRLADIVLVQPRADLAGPSRRFWVDRETGLRLRTEERAPDGRILSNTYFLSLELNPVLRDDDFAPPLLPAGFRRIVDLQKRYERAEDALKDGIVVKQPGWLPAGFHLRRITATQGARASVHVQWGNELTAISLVSTHGTLPPLLLKQLSGSESGFVALRKDERAYVWRSPEGYNLLIGSLPDDQLKRIADSVK